MKPRYLSLLAATALATALGGALLPVMAQPMSGPGMMQGQPPNGPSGAMPGGGYGTGPGMMGGYGPGYGMGPGTMGGYGMGPMGMMGMMMGGYGPGYGGMGPGMMGGWAMGMGPFGLLDLKSDQIDKINSIQADLAKKQRSLMQQMLDSRAEAQKRVEAVLTKEQKEQLKRWGGYGMMGY